MSHWAKLDENNIVSQVAVGDNNDPNGDEGFKFFNEVVGGKWVQTSYNGNFSGKFAGLGDFYDEPLDVFTSEKEK